MGQQQGDFTGGRYLTDLFMKDPIQANFLKSIIGALNTLGTSTACSPVGKIPPPPPINGINVATAGEILHATITHPGTIQKGIQNHWEVSANDPAFGQPHVFDTGSSRTLLTTLPTKDSNGVPVKYYLRCYAQYLGSDPTEPLAHGGASPTAITMSGSTALTLLPSTGSGTASATGSQGGWGIGKIPLRMKA
jgi:hypothetical protein